MRIAILDNRDSFSYNLCHLLRQQGQHIVDVIPAAEYDFALIKTYDALVLSPGPGLPDDHMNLKRAIRDCMRTLPIWGVCLGHQAIAEVFGASLFQLPLVFHGIKSNVTVIDDDRLWKDVNLTDPIGRYHSYVVDEVGFPPDLIISARDAAGHIMSFYHRSLPLFGVQFHPESYMTNQGDQLAQNFLEITKQFHKLKLHPSAILGETNY